MITKIKRKLILFIGFIFVMGVLSVGYLYTQFDAVDATNEKMEMVSIPQGSSTTKIASLLKEKGYIKNELVFQLYTKYTGYDKELKAGKFKLSQAMNVEEVTQQLVVGNAIIDTVRFTIPEGYNVKQIAQRLANQGLVDKEKFLTVVENETFDYDFLKSIPSDASKVEYKLEGYLFPETYEVRKGATEKEIIDKMLSQFNKEWKPAWNQVLKEKNMTIHDAVTMASLVEREVVVDKERPKVAGIFYNRLQDNWNLQSCATVQYVLGKQKDRLTYDDLEIKNPYNTYVNQGLPPGPIGNPGRVSLQAAVYPETHDYFFFVTKKDQSGEHYFSKTFSEHQKYDAKSRGNW